MMFIKLQRVLDPCYGKWDEETKSFKPETIIGELLVNCTEIASCEELKCIVKQYCIDTMSEEDKNIYLDKAKNFTKITLRDGRAFTVPIEVSAISELIFNSSSQ